MENKPRFEYHTEDGSVVVTDRQTWSKVMNMGAETPQTRRVAAGVTGELNRVADNNPGGLEFALMMLKGVYGKG